MGRRETKVRYELDSGGIKNYHLKKLKLSSEAEILFQLVEEIFWQKY